MSAAAALSTLTNTVLETQKTAPEQIALITPAQSLLLQSRHNSLIPITQEQLECYSVLDTEELVRKVSFFLRKHQTLTGLFSALLVEKL